MKGQVIKAMGDKRFGFIKGNDGMQYFFHQSDVIGFFDDLVEDVKNGHQPEVIFQIAPSTKGPRASDVTRLDGGIAPQD
jgi:cold shock CspA family protein